MIVVNLMKEAALTALNRNEEEKDSSS